MKVRKNVSIACAVALSAVFCCNAALAYGPIALNPTWEEWDPANLGTGVQTLSGESATGYTTSISGTVGETGEIPQAYQTFSPLNLSRVGDKVEFSFDIQFNAELGAINLDTDFRAGISSTANNSGAVFGYDAGGSAGGSSVRLRYDSNGITFNGDNGGAFDVNNINHSLNASGTINGGGGTPAGDVLGESTTETHSFVLSLERVAGGLVGSSSWTSDAPGAVPVVNAYPSPYDDSFGTNLPTGWTNTIDMIQISLLEENVTTSYPASFTISNVVVSGTPVPEPSSLLLLVGSIACATVGSRRAR
ncbi:PEP-CTERM sorting domain-containing protein [Adhaeretor mobilis]|uniref:PEP-CTERM protein-sorting domain-containing protein n=1 Tax=Adhaeretor mobilis TaxID=1930276 RepID=A0A517N1D5_9BACT|nr:PEP-CTERM sorting domain-containing protein [Adhaeretor mobilis]QDT00943.1 hypothetical protein HG15A2_42850 [Adhaeretor mobilis]